MCGIAGIVDPRGFDPSLLVEMTQIIRYRGPDGFGFAFAKLGDQGMHVLHNRTHYLERHAPQVGLGNRRLAIIDPSPAGNQPMHLPEENVTITFNGEIYNYLELGQELSRLGHRFRTRTDTEVIVRAYREWGPACLQRFNGMWAFAIWDQQRQLLFCSRDRFGVKPFYYRLAGPRLLFASEIKQILRVSGTSRTANPRAVFAFLEWGLINHSQETFFDGIVQLPPGHFLLFDPAHPGSPEVRRYWTLSTEQRRDIDEQSAIREFRELFRNAVTLRLRSDVPVGVALSGGLDSSSVLCQAREIAPATRFQTFSACFEDHELDEREYIFAAVSAVEGLARLTFPEPHPFWKAARTLLYHQDEPIGSTAAFPQWCVMAEARAAKVPVILGGQGGDEALCGYNKYYVFYLSELLRGCNPLFVRELVLWLSRCAPARWNRSAFGRYLPSRARSSFSPAKRIGTRELREAGQNERSHLGPGASIADRQERDLSYSSIPALLQHEDRSSMAHSIESRLPFLDYRLVQFALSLPPSFKLRGGWTKWVLRQALAGSLPDKIRLRKTKLGFNTPEKPWMKIGLENGHRNLWETPRLRMNRFIDPALFSAECRRFLASRPAELDAASLFRALSLELWSEVHSVS
jgi:asparagine synthase (glutamine-hydrolysing)